MCTRFCEKIPRAHETAHIFHACGAYLPSNSHSPLVIKLLISPPLSSCSCKSSWNNMKNRLFKFVKMQVRMPFNRKHPMPLHYLYNTNIQVKYIIKHWVVWLKEGFTFLAIQFTHFDTRTQFHTSRENMKIKIWNCLIIILFKQHMVLVEINKWSINAFIS